MNKNSDRMLSRLLLGTRYAPLRAEFQNLSVQEVHKQVAERLYTEIIKLDYKKRNMIALKMRNIVDGRGEERLVDALLEEQISF